MRNKNSLFFHMGGVQFASRECHTWARDSVLSPEAKNNSIFRFFCYRLAFASTHCMCAARRFQTDAYGLKETFRIHQPHVAKDKWFG
jgi:hypothetical protein